MDRLVLLERIRNTPALRHLPLTELGNLAEAGHLRVFLSGEVLIEEDAPADEIYLLLEGRVTVRKRQGDGDVEIAGREAPDWLGEASLFDAGRRSASVVAETGVQALSLPRDAFLEVVTHDVEALLELLRTVVGRLRESDTQLIDALGEQLRSLSSANRRLSRENRRLLSAFSDEHGFESFIGDSHDVRALRAAARQAAECDLPVLIVGETGTGKELLARAIHAGSERRRRPFVALNCAHMTETLTESELFGHARGAFTGANQVKRGLVEAADGGTLFLDEIADMPVALQGALLRFLELGEFRRVGETEVRHASVGVIAATHRDLDALVADGRFRRDLFYRLDVIRLAIPSLRERPEDLPLLARHCVEQIAQRLRTKPLRLTPEALDALARYDFPGNVRQLENEIERLYVVLEAGASVTPFALSPKILNARAGMRGNFADSVRRYKVQMIEKALRDSDGNRTQAAKGLGLERSNLVRTMRSLGIDAPDEACVA